MEYWKGWITDEELQTDQRLEDEAHKLNSFIGSTMHGTWDDGDLSWRYSVRAWGPLQLPEKIPAYTLDPSIVIRIGAPVTVSGIYLPEADNTCAQFLHPGRTTWPNGKPQTLALRRVSLRLPS